MLPFPKRKSLHDEVLELDDEDLVLVEASPLAPDALAEIKRIKRASLADTTLKDLAAVTCGEAFAPPPEASESSFEVIFTPVDFVEEKAPPSPPESVIVPVAARTSPPRISSSPRLVWDADAENDVASECLASIAVATSHARASDPFITSPKELTAPARPEREAPTLRKNTIPPPASSSAPVVRLPKASAPPFVRHASSPSLFARTSATNEVEHASRPSLPSLFARTTLPEAIAPPGVPTSVAPVVHASDTPPKNEPTVILLRERPRSLWIVASAAIGALCAVTAMRFLALSSPAQEAPPPTVVTIPAPPVPSSPSGTASPRSPSSALVEKPTSSIPTIPLGTPSKPAVITFSDDQGVAIAKPKPQPKAAGPSREVKAAPPPMVPDSATAKVEPTPPAPPPTLQERAKPKRPLSPEQELSEAQLKAAMLK